jgi:ABC-type multidrug transport system ATPase subunit
MKIILENIGRRFNREWIFRGVDHTFESGQSYAILGLNGSGKSTLLQVISGSLTASEGTISYQDSGKHIDIESVYIELSMAAPYMELIEEFTLLEQIDFHFGFKRFRDGLDAERIIEILGFEKSRNKAIKYFSSGMKQRTKLALAFCSDTPVILLDEPLSNLDKNGTTWYLDLVQQFTSDRLVIICSNQEQEYSFCEHRIQVGDYK